MQSENRSESHVGELGLLLKDAYKKAEAESEGQIKSLVKDPQDSEEEVIWSKFLEDHKDRTEELVILTWNSYYNMKHYVPKTIYSNITYVYGQIGLLMTREELDRVMRSMQIFIFGESYIKEYFLRNNGNLPWRVEYLERSSIKSTKGRTALNHVYVNAFIPAKPTKKNTEQDRLKIEEFLRKKKDVSNG